ncbi:PP2C family protein-serine/threonine phosphatase [Streptomyces sp. NPDC000151]|uniref:PP2C family protein-serine/threonine phosphatase n=1 Tax=Streptomyces sp. NPDC000151 TaxID=3154244 RepID=UPI0033345AB4
MAMKAPRDCSWHFPAAACVGVAAILFTLAREASGAVPAGVCMTLVAALAAVSMVIIRRQGRRLRALRSVAEAVQREMLRPLPGRIGGLRTEVRYEAAQAGALVGGDVYDAVHTPFGVRLFIGDAMGKGLSAVGTAMDTLGAFRNMAQHEKRLSALAQRMDTVLARRDGGVDFVTGLFIEAAEGRESVELVCCGHPPPLLLRAGRATFVDVLPPSPPLGLFGLQDDWCRASTVPLADNDRLLLYTDGVTEARDARGVFYPLAERAAVLYDDDPGTFLDALTDDLIHYSMGKLGDDAALLLIDFGEVRARARQARTEMRQSLRESPTRPIR